MTFLSVFHQQDIKLTFTARYGIDREEEMEVDNESGNCFSDNYDLFLFECTGFHIQLTLFILQTQLVGYSKPGASGLWDQAGRFWLSLAQQTRGFFQRQKKSVSLNENQKQRSKQLNFLVVHWSTKSLTCIFTVSNLKLTDIRDLEQITTAKATRTRQKIQWAEQ